MITLSSRRINVEFDVIIECKIDFVFQIFAILFFFIILILHWKNQTKWLSSQLTHLRLFIDALHVASLCCSKQTKHRSSYRQTLIMWLYRWQLKHCLIRQLLTKNSYLTCVYSFNKSFCINLFKCFALLILIISDVSFLLLLLTFFDQIILIIFNLECKISFYFSIQRIVFC